MYAEQVAEVCRGDAMPPPQARAGAPEGGASPLVSSYSPKSGKTEPSPEPVVCIRTDDIGRSFIYANKPGQADGPEPPMQVGQRSTDRLSPRAARMIRGAAVKAVSLGTPLQTFLTLTFGPDARPLIAGGAMTPGAEVRRFLRKLKSYCKTHDLPAPVFIWVAENPYNENPHVHMLCNLRVPRAAFAGFAHDLEKMWGHGYAHVEKIRHEYAAGSYILKAVNYAAKGTESEKQGTIFGNRYGISGAIRPAEETFELTGTESAAQELRELCQRRQGEVQAKGPGLLCEYGWYVPKGGLRAALDLVELLAARREGVSP